MASNSFIFESVSNFPTSEKSNKRKQMFDKRRSAPYPMVPRNFAAASGYSQHDFDMHFSDENSDSSEDEGPQLTRVDPGGTFSTEPMPVLKTIPSNTIKPRLSQENYYAAQPGPSQHQFHPDYESGPHFDHPKRLRHPSSSQINTTLKPLDIGDLDPFNLSKNIEPAPEATQLSKSTKMKTSFGDIDIEDVKGYQRLSGYTLFTLVNKKKSIQTGSANEISGGTDTATGPSGGSQGDKSRAVHKQLQELWKTLSEKSRKEWNNKARRLMKQCQQRLKKENLKNAEDLHQKELKKVQSQLDKTEVKSFNLIHLAAQLKILCDGLYFMASQARKYQGPVNIGGTESVMLDFLLASMIPLVGIANEFEPLSSPELPQHVLKSLNNLAFIMPGIY